MYKKLKRLLIGAPISSVHAEHQKLNVPLGLAVFSADALSSTAYATDEILIALAGAAPPFAHENHPCNALRLGTVRV